MSHIPSTTDQPVIIGGGVAGLVAALHLAERGLRPLLLEADPNDIGGRLKGGLTVSFTHRGDRWVFPSEHGVHGLWSPYVNLKATLARHQILPNLTPALEEDWIYGRKQTVRRASVGSAIRGSYLPAPFHYLQLFFRPRFVSILTLRDFASLFQVWGVLMGAMSIDPIREQKSLDGLTLADLTAKWSPTLLGFFASLVRSALSAEPDQVPASGFIAFLRFYTLLRRDAWAFDYLPGTGGDQISEPLAEVASTLGSQIWLGATVTELAHDDATGWQISYQDVTSAQTATIQTPTVVLAIDAPTAQRLLQSSPATRILARSMRFPRGMPTAVIRLWFERSPRGSAEAGIFSGDFVMDNFFWLDRLQPAYLDWYEATGGSVIEMHIYGPPQLLAERDGVLLPRVIADTYRAFPDLHGYLAHAIIQRNEATHTLFTINHQLAVETPWPNLYACGDWVYHETPALYLERATTTGIAAANAVLRQHQQPEFDVLPHPEPEWLARILSTQLQRIRHWMLKRRRSGHPQV